MNLGTVGKKGEDMVAAFLRRKGYAVLKRNYSCRFGEIDIIAEEKGIIAFVEVKTRSENSLISPKEAVDSYKQARMIKTAEDYISRTETELQPRFDVAEVTALPNGKFSLNYIKNAF